ncbi:MAG: 3,4-dihydroxy-2-butanone-4-phosphate synthase, partial [Pseudomonadota bacterium]
MTNALVSAEEILALAARGEMFILVDHEDRENEGDLIILGEYADAEAINFMAKYGRGLICLALHAGQIDKLGLDLMSAANQSRHQTAFTTSIEAREGVSTGISAHDRATTIAVAINPQSSPRDITTPGHVFPLRAREGGVLVRAGHTEAAVDIARLAGAKPSGVICEIMNDDGSMARLDDLQKFAQQHNLKIGTIADLIAFRRRHDNLVYSIAKHQLDTGKFGVWEGQIFCDKIN